MTTAAIAPGFTLPSSAPAASSPAAAVTASFGQLLSAFSDSQGQGHAGQPPSAVLAMAASPGADAESAQMPVTGLQAMEIPAQPAVIALSAAAPILEKASEQDEPADAQTASPGPHPHVVMPPLPPSDPALPLAETLKTELPQGQPGSVWPAEAAIVPWIGPADVAHSTPAAAAPQSPALSTPAFPAARPALAAAAPAATALGPAPTVGAGETLPPIAGQAPAVPAPETIAPASAPASLNAVPAPPALTAVTHRAVPGAVQIQDTAVQQPQGAPTAAIAAPASQALSKQAAPGPDDDAQPVLTVAPVVGEGIKATSAAPAQPAPQAPAPLQQPMSAQLARSLFTLASAAPGEHVMTLKVSPDDLGPVTVRAHISAEGVRLELFAAGDAGRDVVRHALPDLRRELAQQGLTASLDLSGRDTPGQGQQQPGHQRGGHSPNAPYRGGLRMVTEAEPAPGQTVQTQLSTTALDVVA